MRGRHAPEYYNGAIILADEMIYKFLEKLHVLEKFVFRGTFNKYIISICFDCYHGYTYTFMTTI